MDNKSIHTTIFLFAVVFVALGCGGPQGNSNSSGSEEIKEAPDASAVQMYDHYMEQAGLALSEERHDDALDYYLLAAEALDDSGVTVKRADAHYQAADMAYQRYKKDLAIEEYQQAVDIYLRFTGNSRIKAAVALTNMGVIWKEKNEKAKARTCWQQALQIYKDAPESSQNKVHMQKVQQNIDDLDEGF